MISDKTDLLNVFYALDLFTPAPENVCTDSFLIAAKCPAMRNELKYVTSKVQMVMQP